MTKNSGGKKITKNGKKTWTVEIPICGSAILEVQADSEESAIEAAWKAILDGEEPEATWKYIEHVTEGNVCNAPCKDINASENG